MNLTDVNYWFKIKLNNTVTQNRSNMPTTCCMYITTILNWSTTPLHRWYLWTTVVECWKWVGTGYQWEKKHNLASSSVTSADLTLQGSKMTKYAHNIKCWTEDLAVQYGILLGLQNASALLRTYSPSWILYYTYVCKKLQLYIYIKLQFLSSHNVTGKIFTYLLNETLVRCQAGYRACIVCIQIHTVKPIQMPHKSANIVLQPLI